MLFLSHYMHYVLILLCIIFMFINQSYEQAYTKSSNDNTCKIKQYNNKKSISIAIETTKCYDKRAGCQVC
jgi:hypothetical protein